MTYYDRAEWGARPPHRGPGPLSRDRVEGLAFHWPAMKSPLRTVEAVKAGLRGWQNYHMDDRGYSDLAYQVAIDQAGNEYEIRGLRTQSGANGDTDVNERFGAVLLVLAPAEEPSKAMTATVRKIVTRHRRLFPNSRRLVGHSEIRPEPTACPGPAAMVALRAGEFEPSTATPEPRPWTQGPNVDDAKAALRKARRETDGKARKRKVSAVLERIRATLPRWRRRS